MEHKNEIDMLMIKTYLKKGFDIFTLFISNLSWGKFIVFIILVSIISDKIQSFLMPNQEDNWLHALTGIFIVGSIGMKILMNSKVKAEKMAVNALNLAEKETLLRQLADAKVQVMQAQIEPHFLFNTLSSLQFLIDHDKNKAIEMLNNLTSYLRYALPNIRENKATNTLEKEIENIKAYLNIMEVRMGERLQFDVNLPEDLKKACFPMMMLQPIVENAIKYGIEESIDGGIITIDVSKNNNFLEVKVIDTGVGMVASLNSKNKSGNGMALQNIKDRLKILYGDDGMLTLQSNEPRGFIAKINIPLNYN